MMSLTRLISLRDRERPQSFICNLMSLLRCNLMELMRVNLRRNKCFKGGTRWNTWRTLTQFLGWRMELNSILSKIRRISKKNIILWIKLSKVGLELHIGRSSRLNRLWVLIDQDLSGLGVRTQMKHLHHYPQRSIHLRVMALVSLLSASKSTTLLKTLTAVVMTLILWSQWPRFLEEVPLLNLQSTGLTLSTTWSSLSKLPKK